MISASLTSGIDCSKTSLTWLSVSGDSQDWERAYVHRDILNTHYELIWHKLTLKEFICEQNVLKLCLFAKKDASYCKICEFSSFVIFKVKVLQYQRWGGKRKRFSMTYSLNNKCTKNYCNLTILVQNIGEDAVGCFFLRHSVFVSCICIINCVYCNCTTILVK